MNLESSLTPLEVAELLKITKNTVYELIKRGEIPSYKIGKKIRIDKHDVEDYINSQKNNIKLSNAYKNDISTYSFSNDNNNTDAKNINAYTTKYE